MNARMREQRRREISERRTRPISPQRIFFSISGTGGVVEIEPDRPVDLCIEATDAAGELVDWLTDEWWIEVQSLLRNRKVTIVILPTPGALFDSVILHQLEMVRRISHGWRIVGYALGAHIRDHINIDRWVYSPYDEIRFCEDEIAQLNGDAHIVYNIISEAARMPRLKGYHQSHIRLVPSLPSQYKTAAQPQAPPAHEAAPSHRSLHQDHRLQGDNPVQSP